MSELDLAWAAGFVDGEGYIGITTRRTGRQAGNKTFIFDIAQVDRRPLDKIASLFGGPVYGPYKPKTPNSSPYHRFTVAAKRARDIVEKLRPYLVLKQEQADKALAEWEEYKCQKESSRVSIVSTSNARG